MDIITAGIALTAAAITITVLVLAAFRAGTRRQERAGSLACHAPGRAARLTRRVTGLYAETPPARCRAVTAGRVPAAAPARKGARTS
ncbi:MAG TPA: hypothetical protein VMV07_27415 [Streptosporangiaceae bacterium]|nr:hypothetical protein [Streptosporangiaceae bacterium]